MVLTPVLCVSLPSFTLHVLSVWAFCFCMFFSAPALLRPSALSHAFCFLELPHPHPMSFLMHFAFLSCWPHYLPAFVPFAPSAKSFMLQKRKKKRGGIETQKKPKQKLILSVMQSAASSWWPLCVPVACSLLAHPNRLPCVPPSCPPCPSCQ